MMVELVSESNPPPKVGTVVQYDMGVGLEKLTETKSGNYYVSWVEGKNIFLEQIFKL